MHRKDKISEYNHEKELTFCKISLVAKYTQAQQIYLSTLFKALCLFSTR